MYQSRYVHISAMLFGWLFLAPNPYFPEEENSWSQLGRKFGCPSEWCASLVQVQWGNPEGELMASSDVCDLAEFRLQEWAQEPLWGAVSSLPTVVPAWRLSLALPRHWAPWHPGQLGREDWLRPSDFCHTSASLAAWCWAGWWDTPGDPGCVMCPTHVCLSFPQLHWKLLWRQRVSLSLLWPSGWRAKNRNYQQVWTHRNWCGLCLFQITVVCSLPGRCWDFVIKCAWHFISCSGGFVLPCSWSTNDVSKGRKWCQVDTGKSRLYCALQGKS